VMLLLEQKIRIMEHENLGERVFAAERINKKRQLCAIASIFSDPHTMFLNEEPKFWDPHTMLFLNEEPKFWDTDTIMFLNEEPTSDLLGCAEKF
jgi:hypothetical protein